ncbi:unnamed protein product [Ranitomeya imitator]|uniref:HMG box domain-containing protein n=1 Tax=Ranitomeya imitator TaxID=111125 RepID=A0ABN9M967_9NEOB|nr:unnamed protein product [Ranitomeya imitator]
MKDVPSTERMVLCSQRWKLLSQKEKDAYHKKCEQKKKEYEVELMRFLESLPEEEQKRVLTEKMVGISKKSNPASKVTTQDANKTKSKPKKKAADERGKLPETPKTSEEIWQQSVIGDYLVVCEEGWPTTSIAPAKKIKFQGEPKKAPMNGYQKFSQELLSNGELNHLPLKERMVEIGSRWQRISPSQKEFYKKLAEDQQSVPCAT